MSANVRSLAILGFILALLLFRQFAASFELIHFQPYVALFFCLAALKNGRWLLIPAAAYLISTVLMVGGIEIWMLSPLAAYALIVCWGRCFSPQSGLFSILAGALGSAGIFYVFTNLISWLTSGRYPYSLVGLGQALWTGLPSDPLATWTFLRNDAVATLLFTGVFLLLQKLPEPEPVSEVAVA